MLRNKFHGNRFMAQAKKIFEVFLPDDILAWRPFWSCDPDAENNLWFPLSKEAPHKIWL